jgi:hypothetical protein
VPVAEVTVTVTELEVLDLKEESPPYLAVMVCVPTLNAEVLNVATLELSVPVPREVEPS